MARSILSSLDIVGVIYGTWESEKAGCGCVFYTGVEYNTLNRQGRDTPSQRSAVRKILDNPNSRTIFVCEADLEILMWCVS